MKQSAEYWIRRLHLKKHPEGGYYRESYRSTEFLKASTLPRRYPEKRSFSTAIYFLLKGQDVSRFHRLMSDELWHFHTGSSLTIHIISPKGKYSTIKLGADAEKQQVFQCVIEKNQWFAATVDDTKGFSLVGCTVAPGFDFADFEMGEQNHLLHLCPSMKNLIARLTTRQQSGS